MRRQLRWFFLLAGLLFWSSAALAASAADFGAMTTWTAAGGGYQLTTVTWTAPVIAQGGSYTLLSPDTPTLTGNGCCCAYLPCLRR